MRMEIRTWRPVPHDYEPSSIARAVKQEKKTVIHRHKGAASRDNKQAFAGRSDVALYPGVKTGDARNSINLLAHWR
jgi:hypothetical protein